MSAPSDFWPSCGHHLLDRDDAGGLRVTDEFLKAYLARPELMPPTEACLAERTLHRALLAARAQQIRLFRLTFRDPADVIEQVRGDAVYLLLTTTTVELLRLKPQNLVAGLPIRRVEAVN